MGATVSAKKNDDFDAMAAATGLNGAAPSANGSRTNDPKAVATSRSNNRNRGVSSSSGRVNLLLSITLFFALVHFFDPTIEQQHHDTDVLQNQFHHDPVRARLSPFSQNGADVSIARSDSPLASNGGRERIMQLLEEAGVANLTSDQLTGLPKWQQVSTVIKRTDARRIIQHQLTKLRERRWKRTVYRSRACVEVCFN